MKTSISLLLIRVSQFKYDIMWGCWGQIHKEECSFILKEHISKKEKHLLFPIRALCHRNNQVSMKNQILKY